MFKKPEPPAPSRPEAEKAAKLLGTRLEGLTKDEATRAFRHVARGYHPDSAGSTAVVEMVTLAQAARDTLHRWLDALPDDSCPACGGLGFVRSGSLGAKPCTYC